jgi:hypothetical protein
MKSQDRCASYKADRRSEYSVWANGTYDSINDISKNLTPCVRLILSKSFGVQKAASWFQQACLSGSQAHSDMVFRNALKLNNTI